VFSNRLKSQAFHCVSELSLCRDSTMYLRYSESLNTGTCSMYMYQHWVDDSTASDEAARGLKECIEATEGTQKVGHHVIIHIRHILFSFSAIAFTFDYLITFYYWFLSFSFMSLLSHFRHIFFIVPFLHLFIFSRHAIFRPFQSYWYFRRYFSIIFSAIAIY
jgi:hypothetical protein